MGMGGNNKMGMGGNNKMGMFNQKRMRIIKMNTINENNNHTNTYDRPPIRIIKRGEKNIHIKIDDSNVISIKFISSSGDKVMISINKDRPLKDLFKEYARRLKFPEFYLGENIVFIFNGRKIDVNDEMHTIGEFFPKDLITIIAIDQKAVIGANNYNIIKKNFYKKYIKQTTLN